jgi:hypothetical protein
MPLYLGRPADVTMRAAICAGFRHDLLFDRSSLTRWRQRLGDWIAASAKKLEIRVSFCW